MLFVLKQWKLIHSSVQIDFCCADCVKSFKNVNSILRNACYQLWKNCKLTSGRNPEIKAPNQVLNKQFPLPCSPCSGNVLWYPEDCYTAMLLFWDTFSSFFHLSAENLTKNNFQEVSLITSPPPYRQPNQTVGSHNRVLTRMHSLTTSPLLNTAKYCVQWSTWTRRITAME